MQQIFSVWSALPVKRRVVVVLATVAMFAAVLSVSNMATRPSMALLYSGLDAAAAGEVTAALDAEGVVHEVRGTSIFVPATRRDALRLDLASQGLPADSTRGYELLDSLTGFGTTSQMFDAAYWRAKEGELARTIVANPQIQTARVHIANTSARPFRREENLTASVTVATRGGSLDVQTARALKYLVASAVAGLTPDAVSIIDTRGGLILGGEELQTSKAGDDRAVELRRNIERLLAARVGHGNAVVEVSVETVSERESIVEKRFDPETRVAISSETEERSAQSNDSRGGAVTVASNLPDGDAARDDGTSSSRNSETRERVNYEVGETLREVLRTPGGIRRISVAVLVDGIRGIENGEPVWQPRSPEELAALEELVASTVGFDAARGDTITLKSMEFQAVPEAGEAATAGMLEGFRLDAMSLIQLAVLALVALVLGLFVVRPILASRGTGTAVAAIAGPRAGEAQRPDAALALEAPLDGEVTPPPNLLPERAAGGVPALTGTAPADAVGRLRRMIEERREETVGVLQSWMEEERA